MIKKTFKKIKTDNLLKLSAKESDITVELINETCLIELEGAPPVLYIQEKHSVFNDLQKMIAKVDFNSSSRSANKGEKSILFGAVSSQISKIGVCNQGALLSKNSILDEILRTQVANGLDTILQEFIPQRHKISEIMLSQKFIQPEYKFGKTNFTSGIINKNSAFNYHLDGFNLQNTYSSMIVFKRNVTGGHLVFPEYGIGFK